MWRNQHNPFPKYVSIPMKKININFQTLRILNTYMLTGILKDRKNQENLKF